jgi:heptosyltransferase-3
VILQPGAIGDCILTLPLAEFMKEHLDLGGVDMIGHTEYIGILPGRSCIDGIRSIDSIDLHRLFAESGTFDLADRDSLINTFADYCWIVTFLGEPDSDFEQNLIFTVNCSHSAEVITLSMKPPKEFTEHLTDFYSQQLIGQSGLSLSRRQGRYNGCLIRATRADKKKAGELLQEIGVDFDERLVVIAPGSGGVQKCWHLDNFLAVAEELTLRGIEVVFLLGLAELERFDNATIRDITRVAKCLADLPLTDVCGLLSCADGFVGNDSGITHLAASLGVRTVAVFGPSDPALYRPSGPAVTVFKSDSTGFSGEQAVVLQQKLLAALVNITAESSG